MNAQLSVDDVMTGKVVTVRVDTFVEEITRTLARHRIGAVPVVDQSRHVLGIVAESDLLAGSVSGSGPPPATAGDVMTSPAITVLPGTGLEEARALLKTWDIGRLPVVDGTGVLVGIVSRRDLLMSYLPTDAEIRRRVMERVIDLGGEADAVSVSNGSVRVHAQVARRSEIPILDRMLRDTPGVHRLDLDADYELDDRDTP